jgi:hypothetical protein
MMLKSLFGELGTIGAPTPAREERAAPAFAATALLESVAGEVNAQGQIVDRHLRDLFVAGSPAAAMREHFAAARADLETAGRMITLIDPARLWASAVIKALSDASGQPIERLQLREQATLQTLAVIERTAVVRRLDDMIKVYHADVRAEGRENAEISLALMERSHMTVVIVGAMVPQDIDALLLMLHDAVQDPGWRCPSLVFMLPPGAAWLANKIDGIDWPDRLQVRTLSESMSSASAVWNSMLALWNEARNLHPWEGSAQHAAPAKDESVEPSAKPSPVAVAAHVPPAPLAEGRWESIDPQLASRTLAQVLATDGLLACALVDASSGQVLARQVRDDHPLDIPAAASAAATLLRAHRDALRLMGAAEGVDEVVTTGRMHQQIMRALPHHPNLFVLALLDRFQANQALARFRLAEAVKGLVR